jgi:hypothetical protein
MKQGPSDATFTTARFDEKHAVTQLHHAAHTSIKFASRFTAPHGADANRIAGLTLESVLRGLRVLRGGQLPVTSVSLRYYAARGFRGRAMADRVRWATGVGMARGEGRRATGLLERRRRGQTLVVPSRERGGSGAAVGTGGRRESAGLPPDGRDG